MMIPAKPGRQLSCVNDNKNLSYDNNKYDHKDMTMEIYDDDDDTGKIQVEERAGRESWCLRGLCPPRIRQAERCYDDKYDDDDYDDVDYDDGHDDDDDGEDDVFKTFVWS